MKNLAKTIMIFLPDGDPKGIKEIDVTNRTVKAILVPRVMIDEADKRDNLTGVGAYILLGEVADKTKPVAYIGEAENCLVRLKQHNQKKEFWSHAVVLLSKTNSFTKTEVKWLEHFFLKTAKVVDRYILENGTTPSEPHISEQKKADLLDNFETIKILLSTLNYPIFDKILRPLKKDFLYCKGKLASAHGEYSSDGFVVFKGSLANQDETKTLDNGTVEFRQKLLKDEILEIKNNVLIFKSDYIFTSPSRAASVVLGRRANGWMEWKNKDGKTLDELKRK